MIEATPSWERATRRGRWNHRCPEDGGGNLVVTRAQLGIYRDTDEETGKTLAWEVDDYVGCQWCETLPEDLEPMRALAGKRIPVLPDGTLVLAEAVSLV